MKPSMTYTERQIRRQAKTIDRQKVQAACTAATFLKNQVEHNGWRWRTNFIREYAGCALGVKISNTETPAIYRAVLEELPELVKYMKLKRAKTEQYNGRFSRG